jgi:hypothetical protein
MGNDKRLYPANQMFAKVQAVLTSRGTGFMLALFPRTRLKVLEA